MKNHIISPEPNILALLGTLPTTAPSPRTQVLVTPFATSPETEPVQMHFSPGLCQLSPHRITELTFLVHTLPAKCLNMTLTGHGKICVIIYKRTTVCDCTKHRNTQKLCPWHNNSKCIKDSSAKYVINFSTTQMHHPADI